MGTYRTDDGLPGLALSEWRSGIVPGVALTARDERLAAGLEPRVSVVQEANSVAVAVKGVVGVLRFAGFEVRIDPKLPGDHIQLFRLVEFARGLDGLAQLAGSPHVRAAGSNLLDLVVEMLSTATERILAMGLRADYVEREDQLAAVRGRMLLDRQELERFGLYDRVICRYDEHEHDIADNQLLALALARGARIATLARVRRRARALAAVLEEVCEPAAFDLSAPQEYNRHNEHYRPAHELCRMLLGDRSVDEALRTGPAPLRSFLIDMSPLFELFLERTLRIALEPWGAKVRAQRRDSIFWRIEPPGRYASIRPDLLVARGRGRLPIDAKYKRYGGGKTDVDDLTQAFLYAYAYRSSDVPVPQAVLIHPAERPGPLRTQRLQVRSVSDRTVDAELAVGSLHIPTVLDAVAAGGGETLDRLRDLVLTQI